MNDEIQHENCFFCKCKMCGNLMNFLHGRILSEAEQEQIKTAEEREAGLRKADPLPDW